MFNKVVFIARLKELRTGHNLTMKRLGEHVGVIKQAVGNWETGERVPTLETTVAIADFFGVSLDFLTGRSDDPWLHKPASMLQGVDQHDLELLRRMPVSEDDQERR